MLTAITLDKIGVQLRKMKIIIIMSFDSLLSKLPFNLKWLIRKFEKSYKKIFVVFIKHRVSK